MSAGPIASGGDDVLLSLGASAGEELGSAPTG